MRAALCIFSYPSVLLVILAVDRHHLRPVPAVILPNDDYTASTAVSCTEEGRLRPEEMTIKGQRIGTAICAFGGRGRLGIASTVGRISGFELKLL